MSGIAGIVHLDGKPVDPDLIGEMVASIAFRGPDAQHIWTGPSVAFAHTLLKTTFEAEHEQQPTSLDGQVWITADARIDGREDLIRKLGLPQSQLQRPDCELILHAYEKWGEACVEHLLGDFAFAIWDSRNRKLFCARDHFGVKPFYYSHLRNAFIFSNTLNCIRLHPDVSDELNELAIADFLIFDFNHDPATTTFKDIQRLPAAHILIATGNRVDIRRYWSLPEGESIRYKRTSDYVEHFRSLLETAVSERLRAPKVGILMSGGLDSSSVAAFARKVSPQTQLKAHTVVYDWLIPDDERHYASLVAEHLNIPSQFHPIDDARILDRAAEFSLPEPNVELLLLAYYSGLQRTVATGGAVALTGYGADPLFSLSPFTNWASVRAISMKHVASNFARYSWEMRTIPKFRLRSTLLNFFGPLPQNVHLTPGWMDVDFARRCKLQDRVAWVNRPGQDGLRPLARRSIRSGFWPRLFETDDSTLQSEVIENRHPYFDIRLVRYLLGIPELPYAMDKYLLRTALKCLLPDKVRTRPKTPLRADPLLASFRQHGLPSSIDPPKHLWRFVSTIPHPLPSEAYSGEQLWADLKPAVLSYWLESQEKTYSSWKIKRNSLIASPTRHLACACMVTSRNSLKQVRAAVK